MTQPKFSLLLVIFTLITFAAFVPTLEAQDTEENSTALQEFVKKAQEHVKQNEIEEAIELYKRIVTAAPDDNESRLQLAKLYARTKQYENASQTYRKLLEAEPDNIEYQDELVNNTQAAGKYNEALEIAQAYVKEYPKMGVHYARLARLYEADGNETETIKNYKNATTFGYGNREIYLKLAELYFLNEDLAAAENAFKNALTRSTSEWARKKIDLQLIKLYRSQGNLEEKLLKAEADGTISLEMQKELAQLLLNTGDVEKAIGAFKKAHEMTNDYFEKNEIEQELIKASLKQDRADLAFEFYEAEAAKKSRTKLGTTTTFSSTNGITVRFGIDETRKVLISVYKKHGRLEELRTYYESKLKEDVDNPEFLQLIAEIYWDGNNYQKSADTYNKLTKVEPYNIHCIYHAAAAFRKSNRPDRIEALLQQAEDALPFSPYKKNSKYLGALATICLNGGIYDTAIKLANNGIQNTGDTFYRSYLYEILARSYIGAQRYQDAYEAYQQMANVSNRSRIQKRAEKGMIDTATAGNLKVEEDLNVSMQIWQIAQNYEAEERTKDAIDQYEKLTQLEPENSQWYQKLGELYQENQTLLKHETGEVIVGTALTLDGNRSFVEINDSKTLNDITEQVTVSAWIKATDFPNSYEAILCRSDERGPDITNVENRSYVLYLTDNGSIQMAASPNGRHEASFYSATGSIELNTWYHIACVIDPMINSMKLFIDGIEVGDISFKGAKKLYNSRLPLRIGWTHEEERPTQSSFVGQIDDVRIWNIARTENEIASDMNRQLNGDEPGLVAYWKFDEEADGRIFDSSPNKIDGILMKNAKLAPYTRPVYEISRPEGLAKSISAYKKALELKPTSYQLYHQLAKTYIKSAQPAKAEETYRQALDKPLTQSEHDAAIHAIIGFYTGEDKELKQIAVLEEIRLNLAKMDQSAVLHELLGDLYKNIGESDKAERAYDNWVQIQQKALITAQLASHYHNFAEKLLENGLYPDIALNFAKRAFHNSTISDYTYPEILGHACVANGLYDQALKHYKHALSLISGKYYSDMFWEEIVAGINQANDKERYVQMLDELINSDSSTSTIASKSTHRIIAEFYSENLMHDKATEQMRKTGIIHENAWWVLGPFDNMAGIGFNTEYIPKDTTQIDQTAKYEGVDGKISWTRHTDDAFNGFIDLGKDVNWRVAYAIATVTSPDEREVIFRFSSDDQSKLWLNTTEIFTETNSQSAIIDRNTIPVTLRAGKNVILVKVCNEEKNWGFYLRITDVDGEPYDDLKSN